MQDNTMQEGEDQECPKCGVVGMSKREIVGHAIALGYNKVERHPYRESENVPIEGIVCAVCGHCTLI